MTSVSDKRERLLEAARDLIHRHGFKPTTLADIARAADVPLGNVYYYFKTKDDIAAAVIHGRSGELRAFMEGCARETDAREGLIAFLEMPAASRQAIAAYGCPVGSLCQELDKDPSPLAQKANSLLATQLEWVTEQFRRMGRNDAENLGVQLMTSLQGMSVLANALADPTVVDREVARLRAWLTTL
jgi:TetR/AcrR family transcriptional repressor of nem operon